MVHCDIRRQDIRTNHTESSCRTYSLFRVSDTRNREYVRHDNRGFIRWHLAVISKCIFLDYHIMIDLFTASPRYDRLTTHWTRNKMDENLQTFSSAFSWTSQYFDCNFKGPIYNNPALIQIIAWRRSGAKLLSESMILVYWRIYASLGLN